MKNKILNIIIIYLLLLLSCTICIKLIEIINFKCIYKELFNIYCVGCGSTRMIKSIFNLEFYQAFRYNPLIFILTIIIIIYIIYNTVMYLKEKKLYIPHTKVIISIVIILIVYMVLRNIPGFEFLLPININ